MELNLGDTESYMHARNRKSAERLLNAIRAEHGAPPKPPERPPLPPIPNTLIALATKVIFPHIPVRQYMTRVEIIQRAALTEFPTLTLFDLKSARHTAHIVRGRQMAMYVCKKLTSQSLPDIGRRFGGRDHTTVLHAVRKIEGLVAANPDIAAQAARIMALVPEAA